MRGLINRKSVTALAVTGKDYFFWDTQLKGFGIRVSPKGKKTFCIQTRVRKKVKRVTLGAFPNTSVSAARVLAVEEFNKITLFNVGIRSISKPLDITLGEFAERYWTTFVRKVKPRTAKRYRSSLDLQIIPEFGNTNITEISHARIVSWHASMVSAPGSANHALPVLKKIFSLAGELDIISSRYNPASNIKRHKYKKHERFLTSSELRRLGDFLARSIEDKPTETHAFLTIMLTGCRKSEVFEMEWSHLHDDRYMFPDTKTGADILYLPRAVRSILQLQSKISNESNWIFPSATNKEKSLTKLENFWNSLRKEVNINDVRMHDLRHNFASWAAMNGVDLYILGKILRHKDTSTTIRYIHYSRVSIAAQTKTAQDAMAKIIGGFNEVTS